MRYVNVSCLKEKMILAKPLYGEGFSIMLDGGIALSEAHIRRISESGYAGAYISDDMSSGIDAIDIIPPRLRLETVRSVKEILNQAEEAVMGSDSKITKISQDHIIMPIIESISGASGRIVDIIDLKPLDDYVYYHAASVVILSILLGFELGLSDAQLYDLGLSALLHDVGNIFIPNDILNKAGKLTSEEYNIIKQHSQMGFDFLRDNFDISIESCIGALQHHENYNGTGYPSGLKNDEISIYGRIIAVTDVYDALTSRRPYRQAMYPAAAMEFISMNSGTMFDPEIAEHFKRVIAFYPTGVCVELTSGVKCIVVGNHPEFGDRPRLRLLKNLSKTPLYIDLKEDAAFEDTSISHIIEM